MGGGGREVDYEGLFGKEIVLSGGLNSLEVETLGLNLSYAANFCVVPIIAYIRPVLSPLPLPFTLGPFERSSVNGRRKENTSKRSTEQLRCRIWHF